tara:strand:- start:422 stop:733 length:312 start_codon:yes stop_codon:yes gene_type:complete
MINNLDHIDHIAIQVKNIKNALDWYLKNFKCKEIYSDKTWAFIEFDNMKLALVTEKEHPPHFAIINNKINLDKQAVKHRDDSVSKYIKDIDNNSIELIKYHDK